MAGAKRYSIWKDPCFGALIGALVGFMLLFDVGPVAENGILQARFWLARIISNGPAKKFYIVEIKNSPAESAHATARAVAPLLNEYTVIDYSDRAWLILIPLSTLTGAVFILLKPLQRVNAILLTAILFLVATQICFQFFNLILPTMAPLSAILICYLACSLIFVEKEEADRHRDLASRMQMSAEDERRRIAKDIHDETLPELSRLKRSLGKITSTAPDADGVKEIEQQIDSVIGDLRRAVDNLHPLILEKLGLKPALESLVNKLNKQKNIEARFECLIDAPDQLIDDLTKLSIFRIVQEALNNVEKHSDASSVTVKITSENGALNVSVTDDGRGLPPATTSSTSSAEKQSHGMQIIQQRAELINARATWQQPDSLEHGTQLILKVPLQRQSKRKDQ